MTKCKKFPFYTLYADVDDYCFWLLDKYGEKSKIVALIDNNFTDAIDHPKMDADDLLLKIRQFLVDNGFKQEVENCDREFVTEERLSRGKDKEEFIKRMRAKYS